MGLQITKTLNIKKSLHPRNRHRGHYDFNQLVADCPELAGFVVPNRYGDLSIDFADPTAVKVLNRALLQHFYGVVGWDIPEGFLCPAIPGRADYIHVVADLLAESNRGNIPHGHRVQVLDVGMGANCVYPLIAQYEYDWHVVGSDINPQAIEAARKIVAANPALSTAIECRLQTSSSNIFHGIISSDEIFDITLCNPPFHASEADASAGTRRKLKNLSGGVARQSRKPQLNFGGKNAELWCKGGELGFVRKMIKQSAELPNCVLWYSTLISKKENLSAVYRALKRVRPQTIRTIDMAQGQKVSRIVAWSFLNESQRNEWAEKRWQE